MKKLVLLSISVMCVLFFISCSEKPKKEAKKINVTKVLIPRGSSGKVDTLVISGYYNNPDSIVYTKFLFDERPDSIKEGDVFK